MDAAPEFPPHANSRGLTPLTGWGRTLRVEARERRSEDLERITEGASLTRGLGRSYGDASLPARRGETVASSVLADRILSLDEETGLLRAEAGLSLLALNNMLLGRGWFTPVSPGTQFVTVGGMVASDVHGKNHHVDGSFGDHVTRLLLRLADGRIIECSEEQEPDLFRATIGGMGLTGHILEVEFRMVRVPTPWIYQSCEQVARLDDMLARLRTVGSEWPMTVAWIDCLARGKKFGRGTLISGRWAEPSEISRDYAPVRRRRAVPVEMPGWVLSRWAVRFGVNARHYHTARSAVSVVHPEPFFYPLDTLLEWNRMYGRQGFIQYQCVLPGTPESGVVQRFFERLRELDVPVYLCVLKDFGAEGRGMISFPMPGFTLALDIPFRPPSSQIAVDRLNETVIECGGRIYLTKDSHSRAEHFQAMEPRLTEWSRVRHAWDPDGRIRSALSVRLLGDRP